MTHPEHAPRHNGIASLFDQIELKGYFKGYLIFITIIEVFIFLISFLSQLEPYNMPFPWKAYFFAAFTVPIFITFLLGIVIVGFNTYLYNSQPISGVDISSTPDTAGGVKGRWRQLKRVLQHAPYLFLLLVLVGLAIIFYKLDVILSLIAGLGGKSLTYIGITGAILLAGGFIGGIIFLVSQYKLKKQELDLKYAYRRDVMDKMGMVFLNDHTAIRSDGVPVDIRRLPERLAGAPERTSLTGRPAPVTDTETTE
ncbi:MAG: hypothetical protein CSA22_01590 [Deltaproteobacteria bacterium]|nr:MAG: hypothetical protein CSA22_01590 [Deltaproteobacteria bacterium]